MESVHYCERFLELMIDLEAQLPTRRFFNAVIDNTHFLVVSKLSNLMKRPEGKLFGQVIYLYIFISSYIPICQKYSHGKS